MAILLNFIFSGAIPVYANLSFDKSPRFSFPTKLANLIFTSEVAPLRIKPRVSVLALNLNQLYWLLPVLNIPMLNASLLEVFTLADKNNNESTGLLTAASLMRTSQT